MNGKKGTRSPLIFFFDSFLQEQNIKWILGVGTAILLGSSLKLVASRWETLLPLWKYLILSSYTAACYLGGNLSYHALGLRRTGTVLQSLTVLLMPITFFALSDAIWRDPDVSSFPWQESLRLVLIAANLALSTIAATKIFCHFLRGPQPTFIASYLILCLAGSLSPGLDPIWSPWASGVLWAVFTLGVVKVNRRVFWLAEERRLPRIFGFFPTALLGSQFLILFAAQFARDIPIQWMGLGCVLVAATVLLAADAAARVFGQRTGGLVHPLPWTILAPLGIGLILCVAGLCLAGTCFSPHGRPCALVPAAAIAAALMGVVARRTGKQAFVWAMLGGFTLAYNFSPVFFLDLARQVVQASAESVREERLPYAYYGLTYLPLLSILIVAGAGRWRMSKLFLRPIRLYGLGLSGLLLVASLTHEKAIFPVALPLMGIFTIQAIIFRDRRIILPAIASMTIAFAGFAPFASRVLQIHWPDLSTLTCLSLAALILLVPGFLLDRRFARLPLPSAWERSRILPETTCRQLCQSSSLLLTVFIALLWVGQCGPHSDGGHLWPAASITAALLLVHALRLQSRTIGYAALLFPWVIGITRAIDLDLGFQAISLSTMVLLGQWVLTYLFQRFPHARLSRVLGRPNFHLSLGGLLILLCAAYLPSFAIDTVQPWFQVEAIELWFPSSVLIVVWAFDAARRLSNQPAAVLGCISLLGLVSSAFMNQVGMEGSRWLPAFWALWGLAGIPAVAWLKRREEIPRNDESRQTAGALALPVGYCVFLLHSLVTLVSLLSFTGPFRVAGAISLVGLFLSSPVRREIRPIALIILNWQVLFLVLHLFSPASGSVFFLGLENILPAAFPLALAAAMSLAPVNGFARTTERWIQDMLLGHRILLRCLFFSSILTTLFLRELEPAEITMSIAAFALAILCELWTACRKSDMKHVWLAEALAGAGVAYLAWFDVISFGRGISQYIILVTGIALWGTGRLASRRRNTAVLAGPLELTGMALPAVSAAYGVIRHLAMPRVPLAGFCSLALFLASGFYFWRGLEGRRLPLLLLSAVILNVALAMLWRDLAWSDPQFFLIPLGASILGLVEFLKREIPSRARDPLRYLGALVILVSPTFHIVDGSWLHLLTLMLASVGCIIFSIGMRVRAVMYAGVAFLAADLVAMVIRGSVDHPSFLWIAGLGLGVAIVLLGAICENRREILLQKMRSFAAALEGWN